MTSQKTFGSPALIAEFDKVYGSVANKEDIFLEESQDVGKFLQEKREWQKKSDQAQMVFK